MVKRALELNASQRQKKRSRVATQEDEDFVPEKRPREETAGIITSIELRNFMNHAQLSFNFAPQVNFVTGRNGTGKSALLTGLVVGLGGKASATSRGSQLSGFIQDGKNVSEIKIALNNKGPDAYHTEIWGEVIYVERKLRRDGANDYKLKSEHGKVISTKRQDLMRILDHLNVQVENPVAVLNQETSKNFLASKNPADVYKLYTKATMIEQMSDNYDTVQAEVDKTTETLKAKEAALPTMKAELRQAEERAQALDSLDQLKAKIQRKEQEQVWAVVRAKEEELEAKTAEVAGKAKGRKKYETKCRRAEEELTNAKAKKSVIEDKIRKMGDESDSLKPRLQNAKKVLQEKKQAARKDHENLRQLGTELSRHKNEKSVIVKRIKEIEAEAMKDKSDQTAENERKIAAREKKATDVMEEMTQLKTDLTKAKHSDTSLREQKLEQISLVSDNEKVKKACTTRIDEMTKARKDTVARFGRYWSRLRPELDRAFKEGKLHHKAYGPLGVHVKVKDMKYALACELALGNALMSVYVNDAHDYDVVEKIKERVYGRDKPCPTIKSVFMYQKHDISRQLPRMKYPTLVNMLDVDDHVVWNCLVDQLNIQHIALILDDDEARHVIRTQCPQNCYSAYDGKGRQILPDPFRVYNTSRDKVYFLSTNIEEDMRAEAVKLREVSQSLKESSDKLSEINRDIVRVGGEIRRLTPIINQLNNKHIQIKTEIQQLQEAAAEMSVPIDVESLQKDVDDIEVEIVSAKERHTTAVDKYAASKAELDAAEKEFKEANAGLQDMQAQTDPIKADLADADELIERANTHISHYKKALKDFDADMKAADNRLQAMDDEVQKFVDQANQISGRISTRKSANTIKAEIDKIKAQLEKEEQLKGNADEIRSTRDNLREKYNSAVENCRGCRNVVIAIKKAMKVRVELMGRILRLTENRSQVYFQTMLHNRNYSGRLIFDNHSKKLEIVVRPSSSKNTETTQDLKGLSGGEKSFSTLCFMLSLWEATASPFRCMDEFDVFMDMVNRRMSMQMIIKFAEKHTNHQFILLTPQDTSQIPPSDRVKIWRMPDAVRTNDGARRGKRAAPENDNDSD